MPYILNTDEVDERERAEFVHEALGSTMVPIELHWPGHHRSVDARGIITDLGDLTVCSGRTTALRVERTPALARDSTEPSIFINVQRSGSSIVVQHDQEAVLQPGELVMYDSTSPYTLLNDMGMSGYFFRIPHSALGIPHDMIRTACAVVLRPGHPVTSLAHDYLSRLAADPALTTAVNADFIGHPSIELIRAVITIHLRADEFAAEPLAATLQLRILEYARKHLHDPDLSVEQIAAAHHISVRHLYKVLARSEISLSDWIRTRRLEACRHALAATPAAVTIGAIARRHGFSDMSSFSRAFRAEYGISPGEWRRR
ncbi:helix-turn-helix domain-containing protein [Streptomyces sp. NPDC048279]|uniref:helix-turn-helix domain-containing protein n=1 Tax=Streptomyces sp. NPDC048279 TaxID=3154714 RepID=UPI0034470B94